MYALEAFTKHREITKRRHGVSSGLSLLTLGTGVDPPFDVLGDVWPHVARLNEFEAGTDSGMTKSMTFLKHGETDFLSQT